MVCTSMVEHQSGTVDKKKLKQTTTLFSLSVHYILSREWGVIDDQVHTNYHGRPMVL